MIVVFSLALERSKHHQNRNARWFMHGDLGKEPGEILYR